MENLSRFVLDYVKKEGAVYAGIATLDTLAGGPPSTDLTYVMPEARSAISFALPLDQNLIEPFLSKKDRRFHERNNLETNALSGGISLHLAKYLEQKGIPSTPLCANEVYRTDTEYGILEMKPDISLRYLAVASGVGHFGLSGNVITKDYGAAIILGGIVTTAELEPTPPLSPDDNYCDSCRLCMASCASGMMSPDEKTTVTMGGVEFTYSKRRSYLRCEYICGGFTGLHSSGKWSTWSPGRFVIPEDENEFRDLLIESVKAYEKWPETWGGHYHLLMGRPLYLTCGNCSLICHPEKEIRKKRYKMLTDSGVVVQKPDGSLKALSPKGARDYLSSLDEEIRALYGVK
ncbi:MAG: epoxyqueuosine reductase [Thermodesulfobacteriota bacterium]|nr:epoxyqueuosine reductase [Thermodesulfobacteriota bacterium]